MQTGEGFSAQLCLLLSCFSIYHACLVAVCQYTSAGAAALYLLFVVMSTIVGCSAKRTALDTNVIATNWLLTVGLQPLSRTMTYKNKRIDSR